MSQTRHFRGATKVADELARDTHEIQYFEEYGRASSEDKTETHSSNDGSSFDSGSNVGCDHRTIKCTQQESATVLQSAGYDAFGCFQNRNDHEAQTQGPSTSPSTPAASIRQDLTATYATSSRNLYDACGNASAPQYVLLRVFNGPVLNHTKDQRIPDLYDKLVRREDCWNTYELCATIKDEMCWAFMDGIHEKCDHAKVELLLMHRQDLSNFEHYDHGPEVALLHMKDESSSELVDSLQDAWGQLRGIDHQTSIADIPILYAGILFPSHEDEHDEGEVVAFNSILDAILARRAKRPITVPPGFLENSIRTLQDVMQHNLMQTLISESVDAREIEAAVQTKAEYERRQAETEGLKKKLAGKLAYINGQQALVAEQDKLIDQQRAVIADLNKKLRSLGGEAQQDRATVGETRGPDEASRSA